MMCSYPASHSVRHTFPAWSAHCQAMYQLLAGMRGKMVHYGLGIVLLPNWDSGPPTEAQMKNWSEHTSAGGKRGIL